MQTVVLAAGQGTRMRPLTDRRPKPMLPVAGKPLVEHTLDAAVDAGASSFVVVVGYEATAVREHLGDEHRGVAVEYVTQTEQVGTADAVRCAVPKLEDASFAVLNGDGLYDAASLATLFASGPAVGSYRVDDPSSYGVLETDSDRVVGVVEKPDDPPSDRINAGVYVFPAAAADWTDVAETERGEFELTDVLERACREATVTAVPFDRWLDVGRPWELLAANEWKVAEVAETAETNRRRGTVHESATIDGPVVLAEGATIREGVTVEGPAYLDEGATVGPNAYVRGTTYLGPDVSVGHAVEVKNSVLCAGATVGHQSYVGDSVLGRDVNFGAGTNVANLRHDGKSVRFRVKGESTSTGRRKFGVVCGDDAKTGINTSLNAGVSIATGAHTAPGETVLTDVD